LECNESIVENEKLKAKLEADEKEYKEKSGALQSRIKVDKAI